MGLFPQLFSTRSAFSTGDLLTPTSDFWYEVVSPDTGAGVRVSEKTALKYLTVFACVSLVAGDIAKLPLELYRKKSDDSRERATDHPVYDIIHAAPNNEIDSGQWREAGTGHLMLWGNTYAKKNYTRFGKELESLSLIDLPSAVNMKRERGKIIYRWKNKDGKQFVVERKDMLHIAGFGFNGLNGISMISLAREAIGLGMATEKFGAKFFSKGTHPSGILSMPEGTQMDEKTAKKYLKHLKKEISGLGNSHTIMLARNGEKYTPLSMQLNDAQFLETRNFQKDEICGMFHVPPHKISKHGANSNYNNLEQENQHYLDSCLTHYTSRWERALNHQLLTRKERRTGLYIEFNLSGFMKGDTEARSNFYKTLFNMGYPLNRILAKENENPVEGGDQGYIQLNMIPLNKADDVADASIGKGKQQNNSKRSIKEIRDCRSILIRDRIAGQYYPLIERSAQNIVDFEVAEVKQFIEDNRTNRDQQSAEKWLEEFYSEMPDTIRRELGPVLISFAEAIRDASADEMGINPDDANISGFVSDYIDAYGRRHVQSSRGQLTALLRDDPEEVENRVDEWMEIRAGKIAANETVRAANAVFQTIAFSMGLATTWRIRGVETCPYCKELNGRSVSSGQSFVNNGDELAPDGADEAMKIRGTKAHPPLHQGCDCYLSI